jgi:hypothetical protein
MESWSDDTIKEAFTDEELARRGVLWGYNFFDLNSSSESAQRALYVEGVELGDACDGYKEALPD